MNINLTILGQAISFAFFVLFCMKYVWPPLTNILRERREAIIEGLEKAAQAEKELEKANDAAGQELEHAGCEQKPRGAKVKPGRHIHNTQRGMGGPHCARKLAVQNPQALQPEVVRIARLLHEWKKQLKLSKYQD